MTRLEACSSCGEGSAFDRNHANRGAEEAFFARHLHDLGALGAFDENLDVAIRQFDALHDIRERSDLINFLGLRIVHGGVVLRDQENFLVAGERFFQRADGGFPAHDERVHHLREDDHVPHRHHRHAFHFEFFPIEHRISLFPSLLRLAGFFEEAPVDFAAFDHIRGDNEVAQFSLSRQVIHHLEHQIFEDHAQAARAHFALQGQIGHGFKRVVSKPQADIFELEESLILTHKRVLRFRQNAHQRALIQIAEHAHHRQAAHKFRNQAVADQVRWLRLLQHFDIAPRCRGGLRIGMEAQRFLTHAPLDNLFEAHESAAADEQDVRGVHRREFLVRMLASALRRNIGDRAFQDLQQRLLHAFARNIAGDRGVLVLLRNLVDLVDIYDALLGLLDVSIGGLQELQNDVFDVFADVARFGERRGVHDRKGHFEHARKRLRQERFSRAGGPDQQNIRLRELHVARLAIQENALVVVVDGDGELLLRLVLADHVAIEKCLDLGRTRQAAVRGAGLLALFIFQNLLADAHALVANVRARDIPMES